MRIRAVISLFVFSVTAFAADLTWTSLMTIDSPVALPGMPPSTTTVETVSGNRMATRMGDTVTIIDGESIVTVDYAKREYSRQTFAEMATRVNSLQQPLQNVPGFQKPVITVKDPKPAAPGPTILGLATTVQETGMTVEVKMPMMSMVMETTTETAAGKPDGWEAAVSSRKPEGFNSSDPLKGFADLLGAEAIQKLKSQQVTDGMPLRTRTVMTMKMNATDASIPAMPVNETTITTEVTSISKTADLSMLEIPAGFQEVTPRGIMGVDVSPRVPPPPPQPTAVRPAQ